MNGKRKIVFIALFLGLVMSGCGGTNQENSDIISVETASSIVETEEIKTIEVNQTVYKESTATQSIHYGPDLIDPYHINVGEYDTESIIYEDAEDGLISGWTIFDAIPDDAQILNVANGDNNVISVCGEGIQNGFTLRRDNGELLNNVEARVLEWSGKFSDSFVIYISLLMSNNHVKYLAYTPELRENLNNVFQIVIPNTSIDGDWHTYTRNLAEDMKRFLPSLDVESVLDFQIRGCGYVDDIKLMIDGETLETATDESDSSSGVNLDFSLSLDLDYSLSIDNPSSDINVSSLTDGLQTQINAILGSILGIPTTSGTSDIATLSQDDIYAILQTAQQLQSLSQYIMDLSNNADGQNQAYIDAMLRLSDDIGLMADRIGEMADRILTMGEMVQVMGLQILSTIETTQANLLTAQSNFNTMLQTLLNGTTQITETLSTQLQTMIALMMQMQGGDDSVSGTITDLMNQMMLTFMQMQGSDTTATTENMSLMLQMITMMQDMAMSGSNTMMEMMGQGMNSMMSMMEQMMTAMSDPNSGMSPAAVAIEMIAAAERLADKSLDILNASLQNPEASAAMLEAMMISADFMNDMADKMLEMADKMVVMGVMAQDVAFRVLDLMEATESNLLQAQLNFNDLILGVMGQN